MKTHRSHGYIQTNRSGLKFVHIIDKMNLHTIYMHTYVR